MAELSNIGANCSLQGCGQRDFLPVVCSGCEMPFCVEHAAYGSHSCSKAPDNRSIADVGPQHFYCDYEGCSGGQNFPVKCSLCQKNFCLTHRYDKDHNCEKAVQNVLDKKEKAPLPEFKIKKTSGKNASTANKVRFMKMKIKAVGDKNMSQENKFFLDVFVANADGAKPQRMFLFYHKSSVIGKVLDLICDQAKLINKNNAVSAEEKLYIFNKHGAPMPNDVRLCDAEGLEVGDVVVLAKGLALPDGMLEDILDMSLTV